MKTILLLILSAFTAFAATTYPVLTDNANRTFSGGATNLPLLNATNRFTGPLQLPSVTAGRVPIIDAGGNLTNSAVTPTALGYLDATSSVQTQLDSKPTVALTNVALLNGTNVFTGPTNTFAPAGFFPANNIGIRKLWSCPTNIYLTSLATTANPTNHGDFANITKLAEVEVPALLSSNSAFSMSLTFVRTTAQASASFIYLYVGTNTNYIGSAQVGGTAVGTTMEFRPAGVVYWHNVHSFSTQMQAGINSPAYFNSPSNFVNTSVPFKVYLGAATATGHTNLSVYDITMFESVR